MTHICVSKLTTIGSDNGLSLGRRQAIIWQCWNIVKLNLRNKFQWNLKRNWYIFIQANALENVVWKMAAILSRPQCVEKWLCYSGHRVALVVHRAQKSVPGSAGEWPTFSPPPLESCSGTANVDGPNWASGRLAISCTVMLTLFQETNIFAPAVISKPWSATGIWNPIL